MNVLILGDGITRIDSANTYYWQQLSGQPILPEMNWDAMVAWTAPDEGNTRCWFWNLNPLNTPTSVGVLVISTLGSETFVMPEPVLYDWVITPSQVSVCGASVDGVSILAHVGDTLSAYIEGFGWEVTTRLHPFLLL
jgi:hypothetical protein